jgi:hypothetical protein
LSRLSRGALAAACFAALAGAAVLASVVAGPAAAKLTRSFCHPTGDYCVGVRKHSGKVRLEISTPSLTRSYGLCARRVVNGTRECHHFRFKNAARGLSRSSVDFQTRFGGPPSGRYCAIWNYRGARLHKLCFAYKRKLAGPLPAP